MMLERALAQSLQCPLLGYPLVPNRSRLASTWRPLWLEEGQGDKPEALCTIRMSNGQRKILRRSYSRQRD